MAVLISGEISFFFSFSSGESEFGGGQKEIKKSLPPPLAAAAAAVGVGGPLMDVVEGGRKKFLLFFSSLGVGWKEEVSFFIFPSSHVAPCPPCEPDQSV